jgi:hypothetical protein
MGRFFNFEMVIFGVGKLDSFFCRIELGSSAHNVGQGGHREYFKAD